MHSIRIDLLRIIRAGGKLPLIILFVALAALGWAFFGPVPEAEKPTATANKMDEASEAGSIKPPIGGVVKGDWECGVVAQAWVPYEDRPSAMEAMGSGMIDYLMICDSDGSADLMASNEHVEDLMASGAVRIGPGSEALRISQWSQPERGPGGKTILAGVWAALAMLMVIPVRIAAFLVFQERSSGRLEWVLANQMSVRRYACAKSAASTIGAVGLLALLWGCIFALGIAFMKFALLSSPGGVIAYEQGQEFMTEVISRGAVALLAAGANLAAASFAISVIAIRMFLSSRFQLRITTLMEMGVLLVAFLPLGMPSAPPWVPLFGAFTSLQASVAGQTIEWVGILVSVGIAMALGLVALAGLRPSRMLGN